MKIGIAARAWGEQGGIGVYTRQLIRAIASKDRGHEFHVLHSHPDHMGSLNGAPGIHETCLWARGKAMWDQWAVPRYANRAALDIVFDTKMAIPFLARCKTAMVLHGTERFVHPEFYETLDVWYFRTVYRQYCKKASLILAVSDRGRQDLIRELGIGPERVTTVHLAANPVFRVIAREGTLEAIRAKHSLPERFILYVGHIYPGKNFGRLLEAFHIVRRKFDVHLIVAGSPRWKYANTLKRTADLGLNDVVRFLGLVPQDELVGLYNLAQLTALPSLYESFPAIPLEANACGCPVVISRTGGSPEAAGDAAVYTDPTSHEDIAEAILRVLEEPDLAESLIARGFENVRRFSWESTADRTIRALEDVVLR